MKKPKPAPWRGHTESTKTHGHVSEVSLDCPAQLSCQLNAARRISPAGCSLRTTTQLRPFDPRIQRNNKSLFFKPLSFGMGCYRSRVLIPNSNMNGFPTPPSKQFSDSSWVFYSSTQQVTLFPWREHQIPQVRDLVLQDCSPPTMGWWQIQVITCASGLLAIHWRFRRSPLWMCLIC